MDKLDKKLFDDLNLDIKIPNECENVINETLHKKVRHFSFIKFISSACAMILITAGIVYAGTNIYDKIWKTPEKIVGFSSNENTITEEQQKKAMTEEEARERTEKILEKFGYKNEKINSMELKNNQVNYELTWYINTDKKINISFDADKGENFNLSVDTILNENIQKYRTTQKDAEKTARDLCKKYGYDLNEYNNVKITSNMNSEEESYIWYIRFFKEYDGMVNPGEFIYVSFIPEVNKIYQFCVSNKKFDDNPIEITKEDAKEKALKEEQKITTRYDVKNIDVELNIVQMNSDAYLRINDYEQLQEQTSENYVPEKTVNYRTDNRIRKAWVVTINYDIPNPSNIFNISYNRNDKQFSYYVDATTGEIIGGSSIYKNN